MSGKTQKDGPKRLSSALTLAEAWRDEEIHGEVFSSVTTSTGYIITADRETVWNGYKSQVLLVRNRPLGLVLALRASAASLGKVALGVLHRAIEIPAAKGMRRLGVGIFENTETPANTPTPYVRLDSLADPALATCNVETLRPLVLESSIRALEYQVWRGKRYGSRMLAGIDKVWEEETAMLKHIGLDVPEDILGKYSVMKVSWRLSGQ
jgi:hypothetical protein